MQEVLIVKLGSTFPSLAARRGDFEDWVRAGLELGPMETVSVAPLAGDSLPAPRRFMGIVLTGSHRMVTQQEGWLRRAASWLREVVVAEVPLLAICYGHQLLAHVAGGAVDYSPAGREFGTVSVELGAAAPADPLFSGLPGRFGVQVCHAQSVLSLPPGAECLAASVREPHQAFRVGRRAWGVQFHPEFDADVTRTYVRQFATELQAEGQDPVELEANVSETPHCAAVLKCFGLLCRREERL